MNGLPDTGPTGSSPADGADLLGWLVDRVAESLGLDPAEVDIDRPLVDLGLSSRDAVALTGDLEDLLDTVLEPTLVWQHPTLADLARHLTGTGDPQPTSTPTTTAVTGAEALDVATAAAAATAAGAGSATNAVTGERPATEPSAPDDAVAIIGVGLRFPGGPGRPDGVVRPHEFWDLLTGGGDAISAVPAGRWEAFDGGAAAADGTAGGIIDQGGFIGDVAGFDAEFFGISPAEAALMDPRQRLLLEVAWEALDHAGITPASLRGSTTGVFVGVASSEYAHLTFADAQRVEGWTSTGAATSIITGRLSYLLDLRGPSLAVDTACSSSLVALHSARASLLAGESSLALVGGVNLLLSPLVTAAFAAGGALAADGRCKAFAAAADGIVRGEGCGVVLLKRLRDAERDGDRVLAVVRGSAVNSDGRSNGLTAPNPAAQEALLRTAYAVSGIAPGSVDYVEAHGTGTPLGDPIEATALAAALGPDAGRAAGEPLLLGSVKTNIGHLEAAAGIAGVIKVALALDRGTIPPSTHFDAPNPRIPFDAAGLRVVTAPSPWPRYGGRARAGVSSFGFGGTNAHVILEEYGDVPAADDGNAGNAGSAGSAGSARGGADSPVALTLSATSGERLAAGAGALADWLESAAGRGSALDDVAFTLTRRLDVTAPARAAVVGQGRPEVVARLRAVASGLDAPGTATAPRPPATRPSVTADLATGSVWVFSGYGSQWSGMGRELLTAEPAFADAVDALDKPFVDRVGLSLRGALERGDGIDTVESGQVVLFGVQVALAELWRSAGLRPAAVIGLSMGEVAAAVVAGALDVDTGLEVMATRSRLLGRVAAVGAGAMAVVELSEAEFRDAAAHLPAVHIAMHSSPRQCTVAGDAGQVAELVAAVEAMGRSALSMKVSGAGHSPAVEPILDELRTGLAWVRGTTPTIPWYGSVHGDPRLVPAFDADHWAAGVRQPVRAVQALQAAIADGATRFLEVSPHPIARRALWETAPDAAAVAATLRRGRDDAAEFRLNLALLALGGDREALAALAQQRTRAHQRLDAAPILVDVPTSPWQRQRHWVTRPRPRPAAGHPLLGTHVEVPETGRHLWRADIGTEALPWLADHTVHGVAVLPGAAYAEMALAAAAVLGPGRPVVRDLDLTDLLPLGARTEVTTSLREDGPGAGTVEVFSRRAAGNRGWVRHATATVRLEPGGPIPAGEGVDVPRPVGAGRRVDLYRTLESAGHRYGPAFVGVTEALASTAGDPRVTGEDAALSGSVTAGSATAGSATARVGLPGPAQPHPLYRLHPALGDLCLQTLAVAAVGLWPDAAAGAVPLHLPVRIGELTVFDRPGGGPLAGGRCTATLTPAPADAETGPGGLIGQVLLVADDGTPLVEARDVLLRPVEASAVPVPVPALLFESRWETVPAPDAATVPPTGDPAPRLLVVTLPAEQHPGGADGRAERSAIAALLTRSFGARPAGAQGPAPLQVEDVALSGAEDSRLADLAASGQLTGVVLVVPRPAGRADGDQAAPGTDPAAPATDPTVAGGDPVAAAGFAAAVAGLARMLVRGGAERPPRLWVVTRGAAAIRDADLPVPAHAALRGLVRVLALEHPALRATLIDLDPSADDGGGGLTPIVTEIAADAGDDEVAWRGGTRFAARLARVSDDQAPGTVAGQPVVESGAGAAAGPVPLVRSGAYIVTGGLGGLGLLLARRLVEGGASRVVLNGRRLPDDLIADAAGRRTIAGLGPARLADSTDSTDPTDSTDSTDSACDIVLVTGDIALPATAVRLVEEATAGGMPLRGVAHAAGVLVDQSVLDLDATSLESVWRPKAVGGWNLHQATARLATETGTELDWWLVYSSAAALLGSPGQAAYATANAWLDSLVTLRRRLGLPATSVNWGAWAQVGGAAATTNALLEPLVPATAMSALEAVVASGRPLTGVVRLSPARALALLPGLADVAFFADLLGDAAGGQDQDWPGPAALADLPPRRARALIADRLRGRLAAIMGLRPERVDRDVPLTELGFDSLMALRARNAVEHDFDQMLPVRLLLRGASLADLEAHLAEALGVAGSDAPDSSATEDSPAGSAGSAGSASVTVPGSLISPAGDATGGAAGTRVTPRPVAAREPAERWLVQLLAETVTTASVGVTDELAAVIGPAAATRFVDVVVERLGIAGRGDETGGGGRPGAGARARDVQDWTGRLAAARTLEELADLLRDRLMGSAGSAVRVLRGAGSRPPLFLFHPAGGPTGVYEPLVRLLDQRVPVFGLERLDEVGQVERKAELYHSMIREIAPAGPYRLGGWSFGGLLAQEVAHQIIAAGDEVELVLMIDTILPLPGPDDQSPAEQLVARFGRFAEYIEDVYGIRLDLPLDELAGADDDRQIERIFDLLATSGIGMTPGVLHHQRTSYIDARIAENYRPRRYDGRTVLYRAADPHQVTVTLDPRYLRDDADLGWAATVPNLEIVTVPGDHTSLIDRPNVDVIARHMSGLLVPPTSPPDAGAAPGGGGTVDGGTGTSGEGTGDAGRSGGGLR